MKKACCVLMAMAGLVALPSATRADTVITTAPGDDPNIQFDPDGVPYSVTEKRPDRATPAEIAADKKARAQAALDKDWLLRGYEKQLQTHATTSTSLDKNANPYQEISANKELAKLAGLTDYHADSTDSEPLYRTRDAQANRSTVGLRPGSGSTTPLLGSAAFGSSFLTPLVEPISAPDAAGLKNFYASLPEPGVTPLNGSTPPPALEPRKSIIPDPTDNDIETPGMIAAKNNPLTDPATLDTGLDMLPGESIEHAKAHQDNSESLLQLPVPMSADQLHREQATYLNAPVAKAVDPNQPNSATALNPAKPTTPPLEDYHQPVPISQMPVIMPVHAPVSNPYDILDR